MVDEDGESWLQFVVQSCDDSGCGAAPRQLPLHTRLLWLSITHLTAGRVALEA